MLIFCSIKYVSQMLIYHEILLLMKDGNRFGVGIEIIRRWRLRSLFGGGFRWRVVRWLVIMTFFLQKENFLSVFKER